MSLRRLPLLAVLLTALGAAPAVHAQSKAVAGTKATQTVLPVMNKGSGKVEAVLLLEPTGPSGPGARWRFGNNTLDAAFGLEAGDSLGLLCNGPGSGDINSLASHCLLANLGGDAADAGVHGGRKTRPDPSATGMPPAQQRGGIRGPARSARRAWCPRRHCHCPARTGSCRG